MYYWVRIGYTDIVFSNETEALTFARLAKCNHKEDELRVDITLLSEEEYEVRFCKKDED